MSITYKGTSSGVVVYGDNTTTQALFSVANNWGSVVDVDIRRLCLQNDATNFTTTVPIPLMKVFRISSDDIIGGVLLPKATFDTQMSSSNQVEVRSNFQTSSVAFPDIGTILTTTELSRVTGSNVIWQQYTHRMHTGYGQVLSWDYNMLPYLVEVEDFILHPGEALLIEVTTVNPDANSRDRTIAWAQVMWEESPTTSSFIYSISGITKDSASVALGSCDVYLMRKLDDETTQYITKSISDPVTGEYSFLANPNISTYFVIARKEGFPNVYDVTDFTLTPVNI